MSSSHIHNTGRQLSVSHKFCAIHMYIPEFCAQAWNLIASSLNENENEAASFPDTKLQTQARVSTQVQNYIPGRNFPIQVQNNLQTQAQIFLRRYNFTYPGTNFPTQVRIFLPRYKITYPGTNIPTQVGKL
jgi:hypothetical protein